MSDFEFNSIIISILVAFALSEILSSWGKLVRRRNRVVRPGLYIALSGWLFFALILHWLGLSAYRDMEIDRTFQSLVIFLPSILGAAAAFVLTPEFPDEGEVDLSLHYYSVAPWAYPLAGTFEISSGLSDLLVPGQAPAPLVLFVIQGAALVSLGFIRRRRIHRIVLAILWISILVAVSIGQA